VNTTEQTDKPVLGHFFIGMVLLVAIQTVFMLGGLLLERHLNVSITGIPTTVGLVVVILASLFASRKLSIYVLLGSFTAAFLCPLILVLILVFNAASCRKPHIYFSLGCLTALTAAGWVYFIQRIVRKRL
jgi:hypothetical protein